MMVDVDASFALLIGMAFLTFLHYMVAHCYGTLEEKRRRWLLFCLAGFVHFAMNAFTGAFAIQPLYFGIPVASLGKEGQFAPFLLSIYFPIGAVFYYFKKFRQQANDTESLEAEIPFEENI